MAKLPTKSFPLFYVRRLYKVASEAPASTEKKTTTNFATDSDSKTESAALKKDRKTTANWNPAETHSDDADMVMKLTEKFLPENPPF